MRTAVQIRAPRFLETPAGAGVSPLSGGRCGGPLYRSRSRCRYAFPWLNPARRRNFPSNPGSACRRRVGGPRCRRVAFGPWSGRRGVLNRSSQDPVNRHIRRGSRAVPRRSAGLSNASEIGHDQLLATSVPTRPSNRAVAGSRRPRAEQVGVPPVPGRKSSFRGWQGKTAGDPVR